jgi:hypothetical protein
MSEEYENVFRRKELHDIYAAGEVRPLDDLYLLEDVALTIKDLEKKKDFYKGYKKKKSQDIADEIKVLDNKVQFYKSVMVSTLEANKEKSVKFPGSCSISSRNQKAVWKVSDEEEFIAVLQAAQKAGEKVDDVLEEVTQYNVRKREASKLLDIWEQSGKLEGFLKKAKKGSGDIVQKQPKKTTVSIKFLEEVDEDVDDIVNEVSVPMKAGKTSGLDDYDGIE